MFLFSKSFAEKATVAIVRGDYHRAKKLIQKALKRNPRDPKAHFLLGKVHLGRENFWDAFKEFHLAHDLDSDCGASSYLQDLIGCNCAYSAITELMKANFDPEYYLGYNEDVRRSSGDAVTHYLLYGWKEDRAPCVAFDPIFYKSQASSSGVVLSPKEFPLYHFEHVGKARFLRSTPYAERLWFKPHAPTDEEWEALEAANSPTDGFRAVVVIPVFRGYDETLASIYHVLVARAGSSYKVLIINDAGPDDLLNTKLRKIAKLGLFEYVENDANLGFVKTVNYALHDLTSDLDVILLNSDAYVFEGWFDRLVAHLDCNPRVATITPLSNNATICSYPIMNKDNSFDIGVTPSVIDSMTAVINKGMSVETPTGVGFCFYMSRYAINKIGVFDQLNFKLGYGEENDFCQRAIKAGLRNLIACDVFVYHVGAISFAANKVANYEAGQSQLAALHPNYGSLVQNHVKADPTLLAKQRLDLARLKNFKQCTIIITHRWGGGINTYVDSVTAGLRSQGLRYVLLSCHDNHHVSVRTSPDDFVYIPNLDSIDMRQKQGLLQELFEFLEPCLIQVNSFAGLEWLSQVYLMETIAKSRQKYCYVTHDFSAISHYYHLTGPGNSYSGFPDLHQRRLWASMAVTQQIPDVCAPEDRRTAFTAFLKEASIVEAPSNTAKEILEMEFQNIHIYVRPHSEALQAVPRMVKNDDRGYTLVGLIGALGPHKGSEILKAVAADANFRKLSVKFSLIGYSNIDEELQQSGVAISGRYTSEADAIRELKLQKPDLLFIPSVWPETFCYTLSFAFNAGIPPVVFDIGAQNERVLERDVGIRLPISWRNDGGKINDELLKVDLDSLWQKSERSIR